MGASPAASAASGPSQPRQVHRCEAVLQLTPTTRRSHLSMRSRLRPHRHHAAFVPILVLALAAVRATSGSRDAIKGSAPSGSRPVTTAYNSVSQTYANSGLPRLQFEGDSITYAASQQLNAHFGPRYDVAIDAAIGRDTLLAAKPLFADAQ